MKLFEPLFSGNPHQCDEIVGFIAKDGQLVEIVLDATLSPKEDHDDDFRLGSAIFEKQREWTFQVYKSVVPYTLEVMLGVWATEYMEPESGVFFQGPMSCQIPRLFRLGHGEFKVDGEWTMHRAPS